MVTTILQRDAQLETLGKDMVSSHEVGYFLFCIALHTAILLSLSHKKTARVTFHAHGFLLLFLETTFAYNSGYPMPHVF